MDCCSAGNTQGTNTFFSKFSKTYARRFKKKGLEKAQKYLLEGVRQVPVKEKNILDIGCGVGALHLTLLREGARRATGIDISEGMLEKARQFSGEFGFADQSSYHLGDFVQLADSIADADITLLDKVVCCYERLDALIDVSTEKTRLVYALTHPSDNVIVSSIFKLQILVAKLFRLKFRPFWHDWDRMQARITSRGFRLLYNKPTFFWNVAVFQRQ